VAAHIPAGDFDPVSARRGSVTLNERLSRLEALSDPRTERDLAVIALQLTRAEGKLLKGQRDVRRELRIVAQRVDRAERRVARPAAAVSR
jgi:hypothetical protein